jgi:hypothetical protein
MMRDLERPAPDEGFDALETVSFVRDEPAEGRAAIFIALDVLGVDPDDADPEARLRDALEPLLGPSPGAPCLIYGWHPGPIERLAPLRRALERIATTRPIELAACPHPGGPPICWCRPPLPGSLIAFALRHGVDFRASTLFGTGVADRSLSRTLGIALEQVARPAKNV